MNRPAARPQQEPQQGRLRSNTRTASSPPACSLPAPSPERNAHSAPAEARSRALGAAGQRLPPPRRPPRCHEAARLPAGREQLRLPHGQAALPRRPPNLVPEYPRGAVPVLTFGPVYHLLRTPLGHRLHGGLSPAGTAARRALGRVLAPSQAPIPAAPLRARPAPAGPSPRAGSSRSPPHSRSAPTCCRPAPFGGGPGRVPASAPSGTPRVAAGGLGGSDGAMAPVRPMGSNGRGGARSRVKLPGEKEEERWTSWGEIGSLSEINSMKGK